MKFLDLENGKGRKLCSVSKSSFVSAVCEGMDVFPGRRHLCPLVLCWICCERNIEVVLVWVMGSGSSLRMWVLAGCHGGVVPGLGKHRLEGAGSHYF